MKQTWTNRVIFILAIVGLVISGYLVYTYLADSPIVCVNTGCETVRESEYSYFLGVPLPVYGGVFYLLILFLSFGRTIWVKESKKILNSIILFSIIGVIISAYLTYLEIFIIKAICIWCSASAVVTVVLLLVSLYELKSSRS